MRSKEEWRGAGRRRRSSSYKKMRRRKKSESRVCSDGARRRGDRQWRWCVRALVRACVRCCVCGWRVITSYYDDHNLISEDAICEMFLALSIERGRG